MRSAHQATLVIVIVGLAVMAIPAHAQPDAQSEREAMYYRYLEFASYVKGGSIEPHWMADGSSFWYAEGAPDKTVIWKVDPNATRRTPCSTPRVCVKRLLLCSEMSRPTKDSPLRSSLSWMRVRRR